MLNAESSGRIGCYLPLAVLLATVGSTAGCGAEAQQDDLILDRLATMWSLQAGSPSDLKNEDPVRTAIAIQSGSADRLLAWYLVGSFGTAQERLEVSTLNLELLEARRDQLKELTGQAPSDVALNRIELDTFRIRADTAVLKQRVYLRQALSEQLVAHVKGGAPGPMVTSSSIAGQVGDIEIQLNNFLTDEGARTLVSVEFADTVSPPVAEIRKKAERFVLSRLTERSVTAIVTTQKVLENATSQSLRDSRLRVREVFRQAIRANPALQAVRKTMTQPTAEIASARTRVESLFRNATK